MVDTIRLYVLAAERSARTLTLLRSKAAIFSSSALPCHKTRYRKGEALRVVGWRHLPRRTALSCSGLWVRPTLALPLMVVSSKLVQNHMKTIRKTGENHGETVC